MIFGMVCIASDGHKSKIDGHTKVYPVFGGLKIIGLSGLKKELSGVDVGMIMKFFVTKALTSDLCLLYLFRLQTLLLLQSSAISAQ